MEHKAVIGAVVPRPTTGGTRVEGRHRDAAHALLDSVYWSEIDDLLEATEQPVDYIRVGGDRKGFCYLTDRNLWWTAELPGGEAAVRGRVRLVDVESIDWVDAGRFVVGERRHGLAYELEFGPAAPGQSQRRVTRFVWNLAAVTGRIDRVAASVAH